MRLVLACQGSQQLGAAQWEGWVLFSVHVALIVWRWMGRKGVVVGRNVDDGRLPGLPLQADSPHGFLRQGNDQSLAVLLLQVVAHLYHSAVGRLG